jgi:deoxyribonuclease IV
MSHPIPTPNAQRLTPRIGAHMPAAGGLHNAFYAGKEVGCDVIQVFTKSPQQWRAKELTDEQVDLFVKAQAETGIPCVAAHDTYLINPCAGDPECRRSGDPPEKPRRPGG